MKVYGLTGKSGSGKSSAAKILQSIGFGIIDGDLIAKQVVDPGSKVLKKLAEAFGSDIIDENGALKRSLLAERAFSNANATQKLNEITHGAIHELIVKQLFELEQSGFKTAIIDAAALLESPSRELCEKIILITADKSTRLERIMKRDGLTLESAMKRIDAQKPDEYYKKNSDIIIENNSTKEELQRHIKSNIQCLKSNI